MLQSKNAGGKENPDFKWGAKKSVGKLDKNIVFYESFTCDGFEYRLFDCAYFLVDDECETSIGKLVKMFETPTGAKKVKVHWFFRPVDIRDLLGEYEPQWDELFLACGDGAGVWTINDVDSVLGKCIVVCVSDDRRNPQPSRNELRNANYVFSRTFDTGLEIISEDFADVIAGIRVDNFFNKRRDSQPLPRLNSSAATISRPSPVKSFCSESRSTKLGENDNRDGKLMRTTSSVKRDLLSKDRPDHVHVKKNPIVNTDITPRGLKTTTRALGNLIPSGSSDDPKPSKRRKLVLNSPETNDSGPESGEKKFIKKPPIEEKAPTKNIDNGISSQVSWFKKLPFEKELQEAIIKDRVLLIENLEPSCTSLEVEDLCSQAFNEKVYAKMIPATLVSNPNNGRALVIFQTTKAADNALSRLTEECLLLNEERPLVGSRNFSKETGELKRFTGHITMVDKSRMSIEKAKKGRFNITLRTTKPRRTRDGTGMARSPGKVGVTVEEAIRGLALSSLFHMFCCITLSLFYLLVSSIAGTSQGF
ncbi:unnamed protein product [Cochlearia groenlandica]